MTEQQCIIVDKLYPTIIKACKLKSKNLSLSFYSTLHKLLHSEFAINHIEIYDKITNYIDTTNNPTLGSFQELFKGV